MILIIANYILQRHDSFSTLVSRNEEEGVIRNSLRRGSSIWRNGILVGGTQLEPSTGIKLLGEDSDARVPIPENDKDDGRYRTNHWPRLNCYSCKSQDERGPTRLSVHRAGSSLQ